jgi:hypothetical protein
VSSFPATQEDLLVWLELPQLVVYLAGLLGCSVVAWRLMMGRFADDLGRRVAWALVPGASIGGLAMASLTTPDWNPIAILWLFLPYFAFAMWALYFSVFVRKGGGVWSAGRRALLWTVPSLLLAPLAIALVVLLVAGA